MDPDSERSIPGEQNVVCLAGCSAKAAISRRFDDVPASSSPEPRGKIMILKRVIERV